MIFHFAILKGVKDVICPNCSKWREGKIFRKGRRGKSNCPMSHHLQFVSILPYTLNCCYILLSSPIKKLPAPLMTLFTSEEFIHGRISMRLKNCNVECTFQNNWEIKRKDSFIYFLFFNCCGCLSIGKYTIRCLFLYLVLYLIGKISSL